MHKDFIAGYVPAALGIWAFQPICPPKMRLSYSMQNIQQLFVVSQHQYSSHIWGICQITVKSHQIWHKYRDNEKIYIGWTEVNKRISSHFLNIAQTCSCNSESGGCVCIKIFAYVERRIATVGGLEAVVFIHEKLRRNTQKWAEIH